MRLFSGYDDMTSRAEIISKSVMPIFAAFNLDRTVTNRTTDVLRNVIISSVNALRSKPGKNVSSFGFSASSVSRIDSDELFT